MTVPPMKSIPNLSGDPKLNTLTIMATTPIAMMIDRRSKPRTRLANDIPAENLLSECHDCTA